MPLALSEDEVIALVREHQAALAGYLRSLGCPRDLVEDLLQETFVRAFLGAREDRGAAATRAFLRRIAANLWIERTRRDRRRAPAVDLDALESAWVRFERDDDGATYLAALRECLALLDAGSLDVLRLRYEDGLERAEIARRHGVSLAGIKSTLHRAKARLRKCIERRVGT